MKPQESIEAWFRELSRHGEDTDIVIGFVDLGTGMKTETRYPHGSFDGVYALNQLLKERGRALDESAWKISHREFPPLWRQIRAFLGYLRSLPFRSAAWTLPATGWRPQDGPPEGGHAQAALCLTSSETAEMRRKAKALGVRTNALLLASLNSALEPLLEPAKNRVWLIPVTLRSRSSAADAGNLTGFFDVHFPRGASVAQLNELLDRKISSNAAYGGFIGVTLGRFVGGKLLKLLVRLNFDLQIRTGVFTNLGAYGAEAADLREHLYGFPPVIRSQPVGAATITWYGRQVLNVQLHPSLSRDPELARRILAGWKEALLS